MTQDEKILTRARERYQKRNDAEQENKYAFDEDIRFAYNIDDGQWDVNDVNERKNAATPRPYLTMNKLLKFINQVVNNEKNTPNLCDVIPVDDQGDKIIAQIYNDLIEHIEYTSNANDVYDLSGEHAIAGGFGYWRLITEYEPDSFDQVIKIRPIKNPCMASLDPKGEYAFIREAMTREEFELKFPKKEPVDWENYSGHDEWELWYEDDKVFIAEYFENAGRNHPTLVAFTGNGHIAFKFGVPDRVLHRTPVSLATVMPYVLHETTAVPSEAADFIWLTLNSGMRGAPSSPAGDDLEGHPPEAGHARK